jgi:hypothetical protein
MALEHCEDLNTWIDKVFGVLQTSCFPKGVPIPKLFDSPHPIRMPTDDWRSPAPDCILWVPARVENGFVFADQTQFVRILVETVDHRLVLFGLKPFDSPQKVPFSGKPIDGTSILILEAAVAFVSPEEISFTLIGSPESRGLANPARSKDFADSDGWFIVCGNADGFFYVFESMFLKFSITVLPHSPVCLRVSAARSLFAIGTDSGQVLVFNLKNGKFFRLLDLHGRKPQRILISEEFGFIVVFCKGRLIGFTENGTEMYDLEFGFEVIEYATFPFIDGADFAVFSTGQNHLYCFEIFAPNIREIANFPAPILGFTYSKSAHGIFAITKDAHLHFTQFAPIEDGKTK